jgi:protein AaeX
MRFTEINLFGVYVAPISIMMIEAWLITIVLPRVADCWGLLRTSGIPPCSCLQFT